MTQTNNQKYSPMKKWIIGLLVIIVAGYLSLPYLLNFAGIYTTRVMVYNGNDEAITCKLNRKEINLEPGEAQVYRSSRFSNRFIFDQGDDHFEATFGQGQHFINLGEAQLRLLEEYYPWSEEEGKFLPRNEYPKDRLLYDSYLKKGLHTLDNCWDCCLLLPPNERPYGYLKPENKDKRIFVSSRM